MAQENDTVNCPVCGAFAKEEIRLGDYRTLVCEVCGRYKLTGSAEAILPTLLAKYPYGNFLLVHWLRKAQAGPTLPPVLNAETVKKAVRDSPPSPARQAANFILWLGKSITVPGRVLKVHPIIGVAEMGAVTFEGYVLVLGHLSNEGYLEGDKPDPSEVTKHLDLTLSFRGWMYFEDLNRGSVETRSIFMAMKFGDPRLDRIYRDILKPSVDKTGLDLIRLDLRPKAGLIDDALRVEIRRSAMLIADLTENNPGAYWEAGYAEGLGKPVLYTCEEAFFRKKSPYSRKGGVHFDTNHFFTVLWNEDDPATGRAALKAAVRATLPHLAKLTDD